MNAIEVIEKNFLEMVSHNAYVIDFDFSKWYSFVRIVIATQHEIYDYYPSLYNVDFYGVTKLNWKYNTLDIEGRSEKEETYKEEKYCRWYILNVEVAKQSQFKTIVLSSSKLLPMLSIKCQHVEIGEMNLTIVDSLNPSWNKPFAPLARFSLRNGHEITSRFINLEFTM